MSILLKLIDAEKWSCKSSCTFVSFEFEPLKVKASEDKLDNTRVDVRRPRAEPCGGNSGYQPK